MQIAPAGSAPRPAAPAPIDRLPAWARPDVDSFQSTGHLSGEGVVKRPIPPAMQKEVESQLTSQLQQVIAADETPLDKAPNEPGTVKISEFGMEATAWFLGDTASGAVALEAGGPMTTAAYAEFSPASANIVQILDLGGDQMAAVAAHFDRQNPEASFLELKNVPDGMLSF